MELHLVLPAPDTDEKNGLNLLRRLWVVKFDKEDEIRKLAERLQPLWWGCRDLLQAFACPVLTLVCCRLWSTMGLDLQSDLCSLLIDDVIYHEAAVRQAGAEALSQAVARYQRQAAEVMGRLMEIYQEKLYVSDLGQVKRVGGLLFCLSHGSGARPWVYLPLGQGRALLGI